LKNAPKIKRLLIANRGEIAIRIARTCRELGIETVGVFSEADRAALHIRMVDYAFCIGEEAPSESYLNIPKIIATAKKAKADAIHPGYGFLSENAEFSRACKKNGILFVGPTPETIEAMGDKGRAKTLMKKTGVPTIPGSPGLVDSVQASLQIAKEIGYPVLLKAVAGGGGRGMRKVDSEKEMASAFESAKREAKGAFGNDGLLLEKYIVNPHHVEVQILGDGTGNVYHLFERECSLQRRHQKLLEEAPSPFLKGEVKVLKQLYEAAVLSGKAVKYRGAGTVEFVVGEDKNFYFLEMNTRLQVEHPVTEMVTGVDLVREMIRIAEGRGVGKLVKFLNSKPDPFKPFGHAIEFRILAEDPVEFLPNPDLIEAVDFPAGPFTRNDHCIYEGYRIPSAYDSMFSKLTVWGETRMQAIQRGRRALSEYNVVGPKTTIPFHAEVLNNRTFLSGNYSTKFIESEKIELKNLPKEDPAFLALSCEALKEEEKPKGENPSQNLWKETSRTEALRR